VNDPSSDSLEETDKINVVPLADLTLVLLIILMVLSPMITQSMIHVSTPAVKADKPIDVPKEDDPKPPEPLMISITAKGYTLNNVKAESLDQLMDALQARLIETPERPVLVSADADITVGNVVTVLDQAKQHGAERVSLMKKNEDPADAKSQSSPGGKK
jgi:biopolymer transport protein ExbD